MDPPRAPRVSILIPNFNNGAESSLDGQTDLLGDLLQSLYDTLADDPTPLEILAHDDGSTDDSIATLRDWAGRTWRHGQPFLKLLEHDHCGVLSIAANRLVRAAQGSILVRLDGDIVVNTPGWCAKLCAVFDAADPRLGVIGPKQLNEQGQVHAFGDWVLHPKGYHHIALGASPEMITQAVECDHVMGCFYCFKREVYDAVGGFDETILRGQTVDFGLCARLSGYRCWAIPQVEFVHRHHSRGARETRADTSDGVLDARATFAHKWGFDRICPDLDAVRQRFAGTPLLWNAAVFGGGEAEPTGPSHWQAMEQDPAELKRFQTGFGLIAETVSQHLPQQPQRMAVVRSDEGVLAHALATRGFEVIGFDARPEKVQRARSVTAKQAYPGQRPRFEALDAASLQEFAGWAELAIVADADAAREEPIPLWSAAHTLAGERGALLTTVATARPTAETMFHPRTPFAPKEVPNALTQLCPTRKVMSCPSSGPGVPTVALALPDPAAQAAPPPGAAHGATAEPRIAPGVSVAGRAGSPQAA